MPHIICLRQAGAGPRNARLPVQGGRSREEGHPRTRRPARAQPVRHHRRRSRPAHQGQVSPTTKSPSSASALTPRATRSSTPRDGRRRGRPHQRPGRSTSVDHLATAEILAAAIQKLGACRPHHLGRQAADWDMGVVAPRVAGDPRRARRHHRQGDRDGGGKVKVERVLDGRLRDRRSADARRRLGLERVRRAALPAAPPDHAGRQEESEVWNRGRPRRRRCAPPTASTSKRSSCPRRSRRRSSRANRRKRRPPTWPSDCAPRS